MRKVLNQLLHSVYNEGRIHEAFQTLRAGGPVSSFETTAKKSPILILVSFIIIEILVLCFGKWLWNNIATKLVPVLQPVQTIWQILGFSILIKLLTN